VQSLAIRRQNQHFAQLHNWRLVIQPYHLTVIAIQCRGVVTNHHPWRPHLVFLATTSAPICDPSLQGHGRCDFPLQSVISCFFHLFHCRTDTSSMLSLALCPPRDTTLKGGCEPETTSATQILDRLLCVVLSCFQSSDEHWLKLLLPTRLLSSKHTCQSVPAQTSRLLESCNEILTFPPVAFTNLLFPNPRS